MGFASTGATIPIGFQRHGFRMVDERGGGGATRRRLGGGAAQSSNARAGGGRFGPRVSWRISAALFRSDRLSAGSLTCSNDPSRRRTDRHIGRRLAVYQHDDGGRGMAASRDRTSVV